MTDKNERFSQIQVRIRIITLIFLAIICGSVVFMKSVIEGLDAARLEAAENSIWVVGQIEPAALEFELALIDYTNAPQDTDAQRRLIRTGGVLVSRVKVIDAHLSQKFLEVDERTLGRWRRALRHIMMADAIVKASNNAELLEAASLIREDVRDLSEDAREFNVLAMRAAVVSDASRRIVLSETIYRFIWISSAFFLILLGLGVFLMRSWNSSGRHADEEHLARRKLERVYNSSAEGIIVIDAHGAIESANGSARSIFGCDNLAIHRAGCGAESDDNAFENLQVKRAIFQSNFSPDDVPVFFQKLMASGRAGKIALDDKDSFIDRHEARTIDGREVCLETLIVRERHTPSGGVFMVFVRDITAHVERENGLSKARDTAVQAKEARERFFAAMSHEMRTPISGVIAAIDAIRTRCDPSDQQEKYLNIADQSAKDALDQIGNVLDLAWLEQGEFDHDISDFNLHLVIKEVVERFDPIAAQKGNIITLDIPEEEYANVQGPLRVFLRPLTNLLGNALKHTENGEVEIRAALYKGNVRVEVSDTGVGIPKEFLDRIFIPFDLGRSGYQSGETGTGLGLPIAKRAVESMGGKLGVRSTVGKGSTFWFTIPMEEVRSEDEFLAIPVTPNDTETQVKKKFNVLLVEDNEATALLAGELLAWTGQNVTIAPNGKEAVALAQKNFYDLILMDINMPVMNGVEATKIIRKSGACSETRIVGVTAFGSPDEIASFQSSGMCLVLPKPLTSEVLEKILYCMEHGTSCEDEEFDFMDSMPIKKTLPGVSPVAMRTAMGSLFDDVAKFIQSTPKCGDATASEAHRIRGLAMMLSEYELAKCLIDIEKQCKMLHDGSEVDLSAISRLQASYSSRQARRG